MKTWLCGLVVVMGFAPAVRADPQYDADTAYYAALAKKSEADGISTYAYSHRSSCVDMCATEAVAHTNWYGGLSGGDKTLVDGYEVNIGVMWSAAEGYMSDAVDIDYCEAESWMTYGDSMYDLEDWAEAKQGYETAYYYYDRAKTGFSNAWTEYDARYGAAESAWYILIP